MKFSILLCTLIPLCLISACSSQEEQSVSLVPGEYRLPVDGGEIWYKVSGNSDKAPLVLLHGGPGYSSFYLKPFDELADEYTVIRYDQLGSGKSDMISDTSIFTVPHFVAELEALREHLGIEEWHILGHSWGTMLAMSYYNEHPRRVTSLTLASPCLSSHDWKRSTSALLEILPDSLQTAINQAEAIGDYQDPGYQDAMNTFYEKFVFGEVYPEADFDSTMSTYNPAVYEYMWGPSEFSFTGTLGDFDVTGDLSSVNVPVMFTVGEFDEIQPDIVREWAMEVPDSRVVIFEGSSHMTPWNAKQESLQVQRIFLNDQSAGE